MLGAVYGDLAGSIYEFDEAKKHDKERMIKASNESELITDESFISDDTILTVAIAEACKLGLDYEENIRKYILDNSNPLNRENYFAYMFSDRRMNWAKGTGSNDSCGNGALSQISPIANLINSYILLNLEVIRVTEVSHNTKSAIRGALCVSHLIYLAKNNYSKKRIKQYIDTYYNYDYNFNLDDLRTNMKFYTTCDKTMPIVLYVLFNTNSFEDAIRLSLSLGGDTDTNAAIVGSVAEILYGMSNIEKETALNHLNDDYKKILVNNM